MSKMRMPEMSVVRFTESDVIVASNTLMLFNYGNGVNGDAYVMYAGRKYSYQQGHTVDSLYVDFNNDNPGAGFDEDTNFYWAPNNNNSFYLILGMDNSGTSNDVDGEYQWNGSQFNQTWRAQ